MKPLIMFQRASSQLYYGVLEFDNKVNDLTRNELATQLAPLNEELKELQRALDFVRREYNKLVKEVRDGL